MIGLSYDRVRTRVFLCFTGVSSHHLEGLSASMSKKQYILTYNKHNRVWRKMYQGELIICGYARTKTDREAYRKAVLEFQRRKVEIDAGIYDREKVLQQKLAKRQSKTASIPGDAKWYRKQVGALVGKFLKQKQAEVNTGDITPTRLADLKHRLHHFRESFKTKPIKNVTEKDISKFAFDQSKRVSSGKIGVSSLGQDYKAIRQFFTWCWKNRFINERPRNLDELSVAIKRKRLEFFTPKDIRELFESLNRELPVQWKSRNDSSTDYSILRATMMLALNCGYTQQDVSTLRVRDCEFSKRPPRIIKNRSKTDVPMNHLMWKETKDILKSFCSGKSKDDLVFNRPDGRPLVPFSVDKDGNITGGRSDYLGNKFKRLIFATFGKEDSRRLRELRRTGANYCRKRINGIKKLYLGHTDGSMSALYTDPPQRILDSVLCFMEKDFGFTEELQPYYTKRVRQ
jgi:integrase